MNHKLTNRDIAEQYNDNSFFLMKGEFLGMFAKWILRQSPYDTPDITKAIIAYNSFLSEKFDKEDKVVTFTYKELSDYVSEDVFENIQEIEIFNHSKKDAGDGFIASSSRYHKTKSDYDFIDLCALSRNIFYDICRDHITQSLD